MARRQLVVVAAKKGGGGKKGGGQKKGPGSLMSPPKPAEPWLQVRQRRLAGGLCCVLGLFPGHCCFLLVLVLGRWVMST